MLTPGQASRRTRKRLRPLLHAHSRRRRTTQDSSAICRVQRRPRAHSGPDDVGGAHSLLTVENIVGVEGGRVVEGYVIRRRGGFLEVSRLELDRREILG